MLNFQWDEFAWTAEVTLPSWAGFQNRRGPYGAISSEVPSDGTVELTFAPEGRDDSPLTSAELDLVQWLLNHEADVAKAVLTGLLAAYPEIQASYDDDDDDEQDLMPDVTVIDDFRTLIGLHAVQVHPVVKDGVPYAGFEFGCSWDPGHGLGVLMHGTRVVDIGGADTAFLLWVAEQDAGIESE